MNDLNLKFWDWEDLREFLLTHGLATASDDDEDELRLTDRGLELAYALALIVQLVTAEAKR